LGISSRAVARRCAAAARWPGARVERASCGDLERAGACRPRHARKLACASGAHPACRANVGGATASTSIGATTRAAGATAGSAKLGRDSGSARSHLGRAAARGAGAASRTGCTAGASSRRAATTGSSRARSHVGIAACRAAGAAVCRRRWLGAARAVVGCGRSGTREARTSRDRLGLPAGNPAGPSPDTAGTVVERACRCLVVGRLQDRGARGAAGAVVGRSSRGAFRSDPTRAASCSRLGASTSRARGPARTWFGHVR
jgi:hypothetical protein